MWLGLLKRSFNYNILMLQFFMFSFSMPKPPTKQIKKCSFILRPCEFQDGFFLVLPTPPLLLNGQLVSVQSVEIVNKFNV